MKHEQIEELLARRSELSPHEEAELQSHLIACPQCRATATAYERQTNLLRSLPQVAPPAALRERVLQRAVPPSRAPVAHARARFPSNEKAAAAAGASLLSRFPRDSRIYLLAAPLAAVFLLAAVAIAHFEGQSTTQNAAALPTRTPSAAPTIVFPTATHKTAHTKATATPGASNYAPPVVAAQSPFAAPLSTPSALVAAATAAPTSQPTADVAAVSQKPRPASNGSSGSRAGGASPSGPVVVPIPGAPPTPKPTPKPTKIITTGGLATATPLPTPIRTPVFVFPATAVPPSPTSTP